MRPAFNISMPSWNLDFKFRVFLLPLCPRSISGILMGPDSWVWTFYIGLSNGQFGLISPDLQASQKCLLGALTLSPINTYISGIIFETWILWNAVTAHYTCYMLGIMWTDDKVNFPIDCRMEPIYGIWIIHCTRCEDSLSGKHIKGSSHII